jgi:hypothetical protein
MAGQDDLTLLKELYQRGEIDDEQYDVLRRHVLWGTPLPQLVDEAGTAAPEPAAPEPAAFDQGPPYAPAVPTNRPAYESAAPAERRRSYERAGPEPGRRPPYATGPGAYPPAVDPRLARLDPPVWGSRPAPGPAVHPLRAEPGVPAGRPPRAPEGKGWSRRRPRGEDRPPKQAKVPRPPRRRRRPRLLAALTSLVVALALVAAGVWWFALRETGVDAPAYARAVCSGVRDWQQGVDSSSSALVRSIGREDDRRAVRSAVATFYTDVAERTDRLQEAIVAAGVADVPGGQAYADSLLAAVGSQSTAFRDLADRAGRLDVDSATVFQISLQSLLTGAETGVSDVTAALARPAAGTPAPLRAALGNEPACAPYVG